MAKVKKVKLSKENKEGFKLKTLTYRSLKNTGNYENETLEATIDIADSDDYEIQFLKLKHWVDKQICNC